MAYPDLPPSPTFWRCPACGNEALFQASGMGHIECGSCGNIWSEQQLVGAHAGAHPETVLQH
jgi:ribosomal protein S27E